MHGPLLNNQNSKDNFNFKIKEKGRRKNYVQNVASNEDFKGFQNTVQFPEQLRIAGQA